MSFTNDKARRYYRKINATQDIPGATADSKHNYIVTKRVTNPLKPEYRGLDGYPFDLSPPTTPAHDINRPPPQVREATDKNLAERNAKDDLAKTNLLARSGRAGGQEPARSVAKPSSEALKLNLDGRASASTAAAPAGGRPPRDPRDDEIARLRRELEMTRAQSMGGGRGSLGSGRRGRVEPRQVPEALAAAGWAQAGGQVIRAEWEWGEPHGSGFAGRKAARGRQPNTNGPEKARVCEAGRPERCVKPAVVLVELQLQVPISASLPSFSRKKKDTEHRACCCAG